MSCVPHFATNETVPFAYTHAETEPETVRTLSESPRPTVSHAPPAGRSIRFTSVRTPVYQYTWQHRTETSSNAPVTPAARRLFSSVRASSSALPYTNPETSAVCCVARTDTRRCGRFGCGSANRTVLFWIVTECTPARRACAVRAYRASTRAVSAPGNQPLNEAYATLAEPLCAPMAATTPASGSLSPIEGSEAHSAPSVSISEKNRARKQTENARKKGEPEKSKKGKKGKWAASRPTKARMFLFYLVGGTWLVRRPFRVEGPTIYDEAGLVVGKVTEPAGLALIGATSAPTTVAGPSTYGFENDRHWEVPLADRLERLGSTPRPGLLTVQVVLRASALVSAPDLTGIGIALSAPRNMLSRLPPDLLYFVANRTIGTPDELATQVYIGIPRVLRGTARAAFTAAATAEEQKVRAVSGWYKVGYATPGAESPDALGAAAAAVGVTAASGVQPSPVERAFGKLIAAMATDPSGSNPAWSFGTGVGSIDRAALLCLDGVPLSKRIALTLFGDGGCATSTEAWDAAVAACSIPSKGIDVSLSLSWLQPSQIRDNSF